MLLGLEEGGIGDIFGGISSELSGVGSCDSLSPGGLLGNLGGLGLEEGLNTRSLALNGSDGSSGVSNDAIKNALGSGSAITSSRGGSQFSDLGVDGVVVIEEDLIIIGVLLLGSSPLVSGLLEWVVFELLGR